MQRLWPSQMVIGGALPLKYILFVCGSSALMATYETLHTRAELDYLPSWGVSGPYALTAKSKEDVDETEFMHTYDPHSKAFQLWALNNIAKGQYYTTIGDHPEKMLDHLGEHKKHYDVIVASLGKGLDDFTDGSGWALIAQKDIPSMAPQEAPEPGTTETWLIFLCRGSTSIGDWGDDILNNMPANAITFDEVMHDGHRHDIGVSFGFATKVWHLKENMKLGAASNNRKVVLADRLY